MVVFSITVFIASCYVLWGAWVYKGWLKFESEKCEFVENSLPISVVIALRNEAENVKTLLASIEELSYAKTDFEVLLVDDNSTDESVAIIKKWQQSSAIDLQLFSSPGTGKKEAQYAGVLAAKNSIIACTDADCELPPFWLKSISSKFCATHTVLVFGGVTLKGAGFALQKIEFLSLIGSTMAMLKNGSAVMGNGANMAFLKDEFLRVFPSLESRRTPSGDDVFLLHEMAKANKKTDVLPELNSVVKTNPQPNFKAFLQQRLRWASKASGYQSKPAIGVALLVFAINSLLLFLVVSLFFTFTFKLAFGILFLSKIAIDFALLNRFSAFYKQPFLATYFVAQEFVNMLYVPAVAVLSQVVKFTWKGRKY